MSPHRPPNDCPVCGYQLVISRLSCDSCGTELSGHFAACPFGALDAADLEIITVFLKSRGNLKELERYLHVSYPTARARFTDVLCKLGLADPDEPTDTRSPDANSRDAAMTTENSKLPSRDQILAEVASGNVSPAQAQTLLRALGSIS